MKVTVDVLRDDDGRILLDPVVRDVVAQVVEMVWPGEFAGVDDFLNRRLAGGEVSALAVIVVRAAQAAVVATVNRPQ